MACPKCATRVMVPGSEPPNATPFEQRSVERSLEALHVPAGGTFAEESFALPEPAETGADPAGWRDVPTALLLPRWTVYAVGIALVATAAVAFAAGAWWAR